MTPNVKRLLGLTLVMMVCLCSLHTPFRHVVAMSSPFQFVKERHTQPNVRIAGRAQATAGHLSSLRSSETKRSFFPISQKYPISSKVNVLPNLRVIPGGQTIGVKVQSAGILVVGFHLVRIKADEQVSPGEEAGIQLGDLIWSINGIRMIDDRKVGEVVKKAGENKQALELMIHRGAGKLKIKLMPAFDIKANMWGLGLRIRDSVAGVGTLTFYAPDQGVYGALGHIITDMDTQSPIVVGQGEIVQSSVTSISKSQNGEPGEKRAHFLKEGRILGNIERNTPFGIFGRMTVAPQHSFFNNTIPVAFKEEVREGAAEILTVIEGQQIERFKIKISHVVKQSTPATKGMVIRITDPRLLQKTGGIVQGMSGSPIIQNGKLVGAVTHVFVNDPSSGYGCFIEWMLQDANVLLSALQMSGFKEKVHATARAFSSCPRKGMAGPCRTHAKQYELCSNL